MLVVIGLAIVIGLFVIRQFETDAPEEEKDYFPAVLVDESVDQEEEQEEASTTWIVDIKGEVEKPGVYEVESDARINDVIALAGGFTKAADQAFINLAEKVQDEMVIFVPKEGEEQTAIQPGLSITSDD